MLSYSVVILSYNKIASIGKVVEAIKAPQVKELILCDDCSSDGTFEWAQKSNRFNKLWRKEKHDSYALNTMRNQGVRLASLPHVVFLDADCVPLPTIFDGHDKILETNQEAISIGFTHHFDSNGTKIQMFDRRVNMIKGADLGPLPWMECFGGNIAFPKSVWEKLNGFDEEFNGYWGFDDIDFGYRASKSGVKLLAHKETVAMHLEHPQTAPQHGNCYGRNYQLLLKKHGNIYG